MITQHGFFFDQSRCTGCHTCAVACKSWHGFSPGPVKYLRIYEYEKGSFSNVRVHFQWLVCYHCEEPLCVRNCPRDALYKETIYGAVLIASEKCDGCRICYDVCPYGSPAFESDESGVKAQKCNMCIDRLQLDLKPICVLACPNRALDFGHLRNLVIRYGDIRDLEDMPSSKNTKPSVVFKEHAKKRQLVPYDVEKALTLMMKRDPLPDIFNSIVDVLEVPEGVIGRNRLVVKHKSGDELMRFTRNDEG